ncbi:Flp pilus assembly protein CpaB [Sinomonas sp. B1-1]|uniref:Flp pilus assembly protein CpaB n=1 Tax=Sinomonas sp. B1-1 TaxID=3141454 RepID=UPI003D2DB9F1
MKSRLLAGAAALVAAIIGVVLVISYANGADSRAMAGLQPTQVLVVAKPVAQGTSVDKLAASLELRTLPADAVAPTALTSLEGTSGKVTTTELAPGEQLLAGRLASPASLVRPGTVPVPAGFQEVSFQLDPARAVGGHLQAGDTVGMFLSFDKGAVPAGQGPESTDLTLHKVLLTAVDGAQSSESSDSGKAATGTLTLTVAVTDVQATKIVFANEFGKVWLSKEPKGAADSNSGPVDRGKVYQ